MLPTMTRVSAGVKPSPAIVTTVLPAIEPKKIKIKMKNTAYFLLKIINLVMAIC